MLEGWGEFYVIVGASAGALIGLQFVVLTLIGENPALADAPASSAFASPSVVHFGVVLLLSAILTAPWHEVDTVATLWGFVGLCGLLYAFIVARRMRGQKAYTPEFEDWLFHLLLPATAYAALAVSALVAHSNARPALFTVGAAALLLLFIGIHNAWDAVTYYIFVRKRELDRKIEE